MSPLDVYRSPANPARIELQCPSCRRSLFVAPPELTVGVTACPHLDCQVVSFVCVDSVYGATRHQLVPLAALVRPPPRPSRIDTRAIVGILGVFLLVPLTMLTLAAPLAGPMWLCVLVLIGPALLIGLFALIGLSLDLHDEWRQARRALAARGHALGHARWIDARDRPGF